MAHRPVENDDRDCPACGGYREWESCWCCHGRGYFDAYDKDPVNYAPGEEEETCTECNGDGGYAVCPECIARNSKESK